MYSMNAIYYTETHSACILFYLYFVGFRMCFCLFVWGPVFFILFRSIYWEHKCCVLMLLFNKYNFFSIRYTLHNGPLIYNLIMTMIYKLYLCVWCECDICAMFQYRRLDINHLMRFKFNYIFFSNNWADKTVSVSHEYSQKLKRTISVCVCIISI